MNDSASRAARALSERRTKRLKDCEVCGTPFYGLKTRRYCSHKCAQRAYVARAKHAERKAEALGEGATT